MCKIFCGVGFEDKELLWKLVGTAAPLISKHNSHGFGFACYSEQTKKMWTEKFLNPDDAWDTNKFKERRDTKGFRKTGKRTMENTVPTILSHARQATSAKSIENTHPFVRGNSALIHNGTVNRYDLKFLQGTCDSEGILNAYFDLNISHNPDNFPYLYGLLNGSYACCVLSKVNEKHCVDVFKNKSTSLSKIFIDGERGFVLSTSLLDAERVIKFANRRIQKYETIEDATLERYCAITGEKMLVRKVEKINYSYDYKNDTELDGNSTDDEFLNNYLGGNNNGDHWDRSHSKTNSSSSATHVKKNIPSDVSNSERARPDSKRTYIEEQLEISSIHKLINNSARPERMRVADEMLQR